jgi:CO/xanthine dehydrogenase Mo-binding subunit
MTGFLHENEFSRKSFLKGGGALIVGFSLAGAATVGRASAADSPFASNAPYDRNAIDSWITVHADNTASLLTGRAELGQGSATGLLMIAAEELDMDVAQMRWVAPDTNVTPNNGTTSASSTMRAYSMFIRGAAVAARQALLVLAATRLGVPVAGLTVQSGVVSGGGKTVKYGELLGDKPFNVQMPASFNMSVVPATQNNPNVGGLLPGVQGAKTPEQYKVVTTAVPRIDIPDKVTGKYTYVHNVRVPGMWHGRIVRPRGQPGFGFGSPVVSVDESSIKHISDAQIVRKGDFLGVVAPHEYDAIQAAAQLKVKWADPPPLSGVGNAYQNMRALEAAGKVVTTGSSAAPEDFNYNINPTNIGPALASAAHVVSASYSFPYNGHMPLGPLCVIADVTPNGALLFSNSQGVFSQRTKVAAVLGLPERLVRLRYFEGAGSYGSGSHYDEAAEAAALMSQLAGKPVRLQYMRWDEHGWDNYGPIHLMDMRGGIDANGKIAGIDFTVFTHGGVYDVVVQQSTGAPVPEPALAAAEHWGVLGSQYTLPTQRVTVKSLPVSNNYFKTGALRSPSGPQEAFAYEQMIDELAYAAKMDPYLFRVQNIRTARDPALPWFDGDRWLGVLNAAAKAANWQPRVAASSLSNATVVTGRGIAITPHSRATSGVVAAVEVNKKTGKIVVKNLYVSQDSGLAISPTLMENQMVGGAVQAVSRALHEEVTFDKQRVTSLDWVGYPVLRFKDAPQVTPVVVQRLDKVSTGSGEIPMATTVAAVANAFFDATGVRIRRAPMTPARVRAVLKAAGVA